jgi:hypothetical protein
MTKASPRRRQKRATKKAATKKNGAGKVLTAEEKGQLTELDRGLAQKKIALANLELQIDALEREKKKQLNALRRDGEAFSDAAKTIAEAHGIDPESETESWRLDLKAMEFHPIPAQAQ